MNSGDSHNITKSTSLESVRYARLAFYVGLAALLLGVLAFIRDVTDFKLPLSSITDSVLRTQGSYTAITAPAGTEALGWQIAVGLVWSVVGIMALFCIWTLVRACRRAAHPRRF
jgi:uncharacterized membrane protein YhhN